MASEFPYDWGTLFNIGARHHNEFMSKYKYFGFTIWEFSVDTINEAMTVMSFGNDINSRSID